MTVTQTKCRYTVEGPGTGSHRSCRRIMDWPYAVITARNAAALLKHDVAIRAEDWTPETPLTLVKYQK